MTEAERKALFSKLYKEVREDIRIQALTWLRFQLLGTCTNPDHDNCQEVVKVYELLIAEHEFPTDGKLN